MSQDSSISSGKLLGHVMYSVLSMQHVQQVPVACQEARACACVHCRRIVHPLIPAATKKRLFVMRSVEVSVSLLQTYDMLDISVGPQPFALKRVMTAETSAGVSYRAGERCQGISA